MESAITGPLFFVEDLARTQQFYEGLGGTTALLEDDFLKMYWFGGDDDVHLEFVPIAKELPYNELFQEERQSPRGNGVFLYFRLRGDIDEFYKEIVSSGYRPSGEPKNWPWRRREFVLRDPDGYKLIFWQIY